MTRSSWPRSATCCCRTHPSVPSARSSSYRSRSSRRAAVETRVGGWAARESWDLPDLPAWLTAFQTLQAWEAWRAHGGWLATRLHTLGADVRGRFEAASDIGDDDAAQAAEQVAAARVRIRELVGDRLLVLPSASSVAPPLGQVPPEARRATMQLTCLAGIGGLPAVSIPTTTADGLPCGVCLVASPGRDRDLLHLTAELPTVSVRQWMRDG